MMRALFHFFEQTFEADFSDPVDLSIPLFFDPQKQPRAFGLSKATIKPFIKDDFVASMDQGASVNVNTVTITPHGNGTHTETAGHILKNQSDYPLSRYFKAGLLKAVCLHIKPVKFGQSDESYLDCSQPDDLVITATCLKKAYVQLGPLGQNLWQALILNITHQPFDDLPYTNYQYKNPPHFTQQAMQWIAEAMAFEHLLVNLPSVDREDDQGQVLNHRIFWSVDKHRRIQTPQRLYATITEMIRTDGRLKPGFYILEMGVLNWTNHASPSRPRAYALSQIQSDIKCL